MKIGIFGGSFNPPHKMHLNMALKLLDKGYIDKVIYVPTGSKYVYKNNLLPDINRFEMLKLMVKDDNRFMISDFELKDRCVYTYETLEYFKNIYLNDEIYFVCGADNLSYVDKWKNGEELLKNNKFLVVKRDGEDIDFLLEKFSDYKDNIVISDVEPVFISSTFIREKLKNNEDVLEYLDIDVLNYIRKNKLYEE